MQKENHKRNEGARHTQDSYGYQATTQDNVFHSNMVYWINDYCPEYDRKGKRIQIDMSTSCKVSRYYISSDISLCDPDRCLQLIEKRVNTTGTNITKEATAYNEGGKHKDWMSQNWYILFPSILVIALLSSILSVKIHKRICNKYSSRESSRSKEDDLHNPLHNDNYTRGELNMQTLQRYEDEEE